MTTINFPALPDTLTNFGDDVYDVITTAESTLKAEYPIRPSKPHGKLETPTNYREFADKMEEYEQAKAEFDRNYAEVRKHNQTVDNLICDYIRTTSGLTTEVPVKSQQKVWDRAWSDGHSEGFWAVYQQLCELVELF